MLQGVQTVIRFRNGL